MKKLMQLGIVIGLGTVVAGRSMAQSTNIVQHASFMLTGIEQTSTEVVKLIRITNKDILNFLNAGGNYNFGSGATLLFVSTDNQLPAIMVREVNGGQVTTTDVGSYFGLTEKGPEIRSADDATRWGMWMFGFDNGQGTDFQLWGPVTIYNRAIQTTGVGTIRGMCNEVSRVQGVGGIQGLTTVFYGGVYGTAPTLETD